MSNRRDAIQRAQELGLLEAVPAFTVTPAVPAADFGAFPSGLVTFLFTDIEGSTPLWEKIPDAMQMSVAQHHTILRQAIEANGGQVFQVILPGFRVTQENAPAISQICKQLDGIPLAIELAAARVQMLSVDQINARLDHVFRLLTGGARNSLPRHQTLRATIDWSYQLLNEDEKSLLRRLSVFAGGCDLEATVRI